jgi:hypothetical protein
MESIFAVIEEREKVFINGECLLAVNHSNLDSLGEIHDRVWLYVHDIFEW